MYDRINSARVIGQLVAVRMVTQVGSGERLGSRSGMVASTRSIRSAKDMSSSGITSTIHMIFLGPGSAEGQSHQWSFHPHEIG